MLSPLQRFWHKNGFSGYVLPVTSLARKGSGEGGDADKAEQRVPVPFLALADATTMDQSPALAGTVVDSKTRQMPVSRTPSLEEQPDPNKNLNLCSLKHFDMSSP